MFELCSVIDSFQISTDEEEENARDLSQGFIQLYDDVAAFGEDIKHDKKWGENVTKEVENLLDDIKKLEEGLKRWVEILCFHAV